MNPPDLTIVVPCLNEQENIEDILSALCNQLRGQPFVFEIVVVDDKSDDNTFEHATAFATRKRDEASIRVLRRSLDRRGYGAVVRHGAAHGLGRYCVFVSADGVDPIQHIPEFFGRMENGADLVQCSRYLNPADASTIPFKYKFFQFFFRLFLRVLLGRDIRDSTYAFKMFKRSDLLAAGLSQNRFSISPEITFKVLLAGGKIEFVPAAQGTRQRGISNFKFMKEGPGFLYVLVRAWLHRTRLIYWF